MYEAKISFLIAMASSRKGAEDLLEAGIFETLSMCGFIDVQPVNDDMMGKLSAIGKPRQY